MITPYGELPNRLARDMSLAEQHDWLTRPIRRRALLAGAGLAGLAAPALWSPALWSPVRRSPALWRQPARADAAAVVSCVFGRQLAYGADPATEMVVGFAARSAFGRAQVTASAAGAATVIADVATQGVRGTTVRYSRATLTGLRPATSYRYSVLVDGATAAHGTLRTAAAGPHPFRFTAFGDQGTGGNARTLLAQTGRLDPQLHLFAGDLSYADGSGRGGPGDSFQPGVWDAWLAQNDAYAAEFPWMFAVGNHEMEPGFDLHGYAGVLARVSVGGASPLAVPTASTYRVGNVGFVALDSNDVSYEFPANRGWSQGAQTAWLDRTLRAMRATGSGVDFIVGYLHHAPYSTSTAHGNEGGVREAWVPLFDRYQVDLVVAGHNHCYERTRPLRAGQVVSDDAETVDSAKGTTYVVAGGGGSAESDNFKAAQVNVYTATGQVYESPAWSLPARTGQHAVLCVDVVPAARVGQQTTMSLRTIGLAGRIIDRMILRRTATTAVAMHSSGAAPNETIGLFAGAGAVTAAGGVLTARRRSRRRAVKVGSDSAAVQHAAADDAVAGPLEAGGSAEDAPAAAGPMWYPPVPADPTSGA